LRAPQALEVRLSIMCTTLDSRCRYPLLGQQPAQRSACLGAIPLAEKELSGA
jgi:hypothetical protein